MCRAAYRAHRRRISLALFLLIWAVPGRAASRFDPRYHFRSLETDHFVIHFHQGEDALASHLAAVAEDTWRRMERPFGARPPRRTHVVLADQSELANGSAYALGASVWTRDANRARRLGGAIDAGSVWTNDIAYSYYFAQAPWGGRKSSGYGRTHGLQGLRELVNPKYVDFDSGRVPVPWWYPYGQAAAEGLKVRMV